MMIYKFRMVHIHLYIRIFEEDGEIRYLRGLPENMINFWFGKVKVTITGNGTIIHRYLGGNGIS